MALAVAKLRAALLLLPSPSLVVVVAVLICVLLSPPRVPKSVILSPSLAPRPHSAFCS
eukprot:m.52710 g.52710  ORF g.52710 m.52710 type:complete len:58 (-) comp6709_c1_seq1:845-1018(-)